MYVHGVGNKTFCRIGHLRFQRKLMLGSTRCFECTRRRIRFDITEFPATTSDNNEQKHDGIATAVETSG